MCPTVEELAALKPSGEAGLNWEERKALKLFRDKRALELVKAIEKLREESRDKADEEERKFIEDFRTNKNSRSKSNARDKVSEESKAIDKHDTRNPLRASEELNAVDTRRFSEARMLSEEIKDRNESIVSRRQTGKMTRRKPCDISCE